MSWFTGRADGVFTARAPGLTLLAAAVRVAPLPGVTLAVLVGLAALLPTALAVFSGKLVAALAGARADGQLGGQTLRIVVVISLIFLMQQVLSSVSLLMAEYLGRRVNRDVRARVIDALAAPATTTRLENAEVRGLVHDINGGLGAATALEALTGFVSVAVLRLGSLAGVLLLVPYRWWTVPLVIGPYLVAMTMTARVYQIGLQASEGNPASGRRARYLQELAATSVAAKDIRIFGLTDWLRAAQYREWLNGVLQARRERSGVVGVSLLSGGLVFVSQLLLLLLICRDLRSGALSAGNFTALVVVIIGLASALGVSSDLVSISVGAAKIRAVRRLEGVLAQASEPASGPGLAPVPALEHSVVFEDVWFTYPQARAPVLRGLSFTMTAGRPAALVGVNGAGKSTVIKLLTGLYRPQQGRILIDGVDLTDVDPAAWQRRCAMLSQTWIRWGLSIRDNVLWGAPDREPDPDALAAAARAAHLDQIAERLPQGWDTPLSREFGGVDLSGGQWQRVGLARALYARSQGARLLVMDEPTSALDVQGEADINDSLLQATAGQTVLLVSHRFAGVRHAAQIMVLADGRLAEHGDHESLMRAGGLYARMFQTQAERYAEESPTVGN